MQDSVLLSREIKTEVIRLDPPLD